MLALIKAVQELIEINIKQQIKTPPSVENTYLIGLISGRIQAYDTAIDLLSHMTPKYKVDQIVYRLYPCLLSKCKFAIDRTPYKITDYQMKITKDNSSITYDIYDMEFADIIAEYKEQYLYPSLEEADKALDELYIKYTEERLKTCSSTDEI